MTLTDDFNAAIFLLLILPKKSLTLFLKGSLQPVLVEKFSLFCFFCFIRSIMVLKPWQENINLQETNRSMRKLEKKKKKKKSQHEECYIAFYKPSLHFTIFIFFTKNKNKERRDGEENQEMVCKMQKRIFQLVVSSRMLLKYE